MVNRDAQSSTTRFIKNFLETPRFIVKNCFRRVLDKSGLQKREKRTLFTFYSETPIETSKVLTRRWFNIIIVKTTTELRAQTSNQV